MPGPLTINSTDLSTLGFRLSSAPGWLDAPQRSTPSVLRPTRPGALLSGPIQEQPKRLSLVGVVDATTDAAARTALDAVRQAVLRVQPAQIILPDQATRYVSGYLEQHDTDPGQGPSMIQRTLRARLDFTLLDPFYYDVTAQSITLSAAVNRAPQGTAPVYPLLTISGASTNPVITLFRYDGVALASLTLTITTIGGDSLVIDMDRKTITKNGASVISALTAGDFFAIDPMTAQNGAPGGAASTQPYITVSSGAGTTAYRRAYR